MKSRAETFVRLLRKSSQSKHFPPAACRSGALQPNFRGNIKQYIRPFVVSL